VKYQRAARAAYDQHLAQRIDDPAGLVRLQKRFNAAEELLSRFPHPGRPGRRVGTRELVLAGTPYIFVYEVTKNAVIVLDIRYSGQTAQYVAPNIRLYPAWSLPCGFSRGCPC
jgi:toxin ParE1/3/4